MNNEDMSDIFDKLNNFTSGNNNISPDMINNLMNMLNNKASSNSHTSANNYNSDNTNNSSDFSNSPNSAFNSDGIDFETILKMKKIIDSMNIKDDPCSNLLQSLKPYLNDSRKSKVDQYIKLMNMSKVLDVFPFLGGENNGR